MPNCGRVSIRCARLISPCFCASTRAHRSWKRPETRRSEALERAWADARATCPAVDVAVERYVTYLAERLELGEGVEPGDLLATLEAASHCTTLSAWRGHALAKTAFTVTGSCTIIPYAKARSCRDDRIVLTGSLALGCRCLADTCLVDWHCERFQATR